MIYKIGFVNGDVRFVADRDCDFIKMLSGNLKYALLRENTILLNMKNVAYIEKVGEENERTGETDRAEERDRAQNQGA